MTKCNNERKIISSYRKFTLRIRRRDYSPAFLLLIFLCGFFASTNAKTRWSSLHLIPDADFLVGGNFVLDMQGYTFADSAKGQVIRPAGLISVGIMEWVNLEMGFAGGPTVGFKARLINESGDYLPSVAVGARDIISGKEVNLFNARDTLKNAFYLALAKNVGAIRLRIHAGLQTFPSSKGDQADPFVGLEEYFGKGLYGTIEIERLKEAFWPSLFVSWRILKRRLEIAAGAVAVNRLFFDQNNKFSVNPATTPSADFMRPGFWFSVRYNGFLRTGKNRAFTSTDDQIKAQGEYIESLKKQVDSIKAALAENLTRLAKVDNSIVMLSDSIYSDRNRLKAALYDKLISLKILYESEPFEPELARQAIGKIVAIKDNALPIIKEFVIDKKQDRKIRMLGISLIGEMGGTGASDALLDVLSQSEDPDIKIEILIALGKIKETRALYVIEQLANDPVDVVAFTAQEVLMKLVRDKGIKLSSEYKMRPIAMSDTPTVKEEKIPVERTKKIREGKGGDTLTGRPDRQQPSSGKNAAATGAATVLPGGGVKGRTPDAAKGMAPDTLQSPAAPRSEKDSRDVWGMQTLGKDSAAKKQATNDRSKPPPSDPGRAVPDTLSAKGVDQPSPAAASADSAAVKAAGTPKKSEKTEPVQDKKKKKESKKSAPSVPPIEEKNW
jgi:hypothetical protein